MTLSFHPHIQSAYLDVHSWLANREDTAKYMKVDERTISERLDRDDMKHIAAQFSVLFPAHYFKMEYALKQLIQREVLLDWLKHNPYIVLVDMGCGAGAASAAFVSTILSLIEEGELSNDVTVLCIGVDLVENVLGIYYKLMMKVKELVTSSGVNLDIKLVDKPVAESVTDIDMHLHDALRNWDQPSLAHVLLMQSNIVRPLSQLHDDMQTRRQRLHELGIPTSTLANDERFGYREIRSYHQLFVQAPIDHLHIFTIGTDTNELSSRVKEMNTAIGEIFAEHAIRLVGEGLHVVSFENPSGSYWRESRNRTHGKCQFYIGINSVANLNWQRDKNWHDVIHEDNLKLAWVRVRAIMFGDVLRDEMEIRIFEQNLESNLLRLQQELTAYAQQVARTEDRLEYFFPKNSELARPRVLSRMEEDILSVAIIQVLGRPALSLQSNSYAFRPNPKSSQATEYLYEYWFEAYSRFVREARAGVEATPGCIVLRVDIESYFTNIQQQQLINAITRELRSQSDRVLWLLRRLLLVDLNHSIHTSEYGLAQGGAGSGFYANAYLAPVDVRFGVNNSWEVKIYRFVDDIILVIPDPSELDSVKFGLEYELNLLGLRLNSTKEEKYTREEYLDLPDQDEELEKLSERFETLTSCIWLMNDSYRSTCSEPGNWWKFLENYRSKLSSIGLYIDTNRLSRKIHQYMSKRKRERDLNRSKVKQLEMPSFFSDNWDVEFRELNSDWMKSLSDLCADIIAVLKTSYDMLQETESRREQRILGTKIYFCVNRLTRLGFRGVEDTVVKILRDQPWIIRQPQNVIKALASQGYYNIIKELLLYYFAVPHPSGHYFVGLLIHALRFVPSILDAEMNLIIQIATDVSRHRIERLMATETLIQIGCGHTQESASRIEEALKYETTIRLRKNYLLLLGKCFPERVEVTEADQDYLLHNTYKIAMSGKVDNLFSMEEPDIIRDDFYSGEYPDDSREFNEMGY